MSKDYVPAIQKTLAHGKKWLTEKVDKAKKNDIRRRQLMTIGPKTEMHGEKVAKTGRPIPMRQIPSRLH